MDKKVIVRRMFRDKVEGIIRVPGDTFLVSEERLLEINDTRFGILVDVLEEKEVHQGETEAPEAPEELEVPEESEAPEKAEELEEPKELEEMGVPEQNQDASEEFNEKIKEPEESESSDSVNTEQEPCVKSNTTEEGKTDKRRSRKEQVV